MKGPGQRAVGLPFIAAAMGVTKSRRWLCSHGDPEERMLNDPQTTRPCLSKRILCRSLTATRTDPKSLHAQVIYRNGFPGFYMSTLYQKKGVLLRDRHIPLFSGSPAHTGLSYSHALLGLSAALDKAQNAALNDTSSNPC